MDRALSEAALTSRDIDKARHTRAPACGQALFCPWCSLFASVEVEVHERAALEKSESLDEKASELSKLPSCDSCGGGRAPQAAAAGCLPSSRRVSSMSGSAGVASFVGRCFRVRLSPELRTLEDIAGPPQRERTGEESATSPRPTACRKPALSRQGTLPPTTRKPMLHTRLQIINATTMLYDCKTPVPETVAVDVGSANQEEVV